MTTSGSSDFTPDVAEFIEEAFERCGLQDRTGYQLKAARRSLNLLLAEWSNRGLNLWTIQKQTAALAASTTSLTGTALYGATADDASQIFAGLFPIVDIGTAKIQLVSDYAEALRLRDELAS